MRRRADTRAALLDAARAIIRTRGVEAANATAICEGAGFTRGAFYSNFADLDELLLAVMQEKSMEVRESLASMRGSDPASMVNQFLDSQLLDPCYTVIRDHAYSIAGTELSQRLLGMIEEVDNGVRDELLRLASRTGLEFTIAPDDAVTLLHIVVNHSIQQAGAGVEPDPSRFARTVLPAVLKGITRRV